MRDNQLSPRSAQPANPLVQPLHRSIDAMAIAAISGYQRYLSPYKGFRCAHRVLHRGESCSQYVKRIVREEGWGIALHKSRLRFAECKEANQILTSRCRESLTAGANNSVAILQTSPGFPTPEDVESARKRRNRRNSTNNNDCCNNNNCNVGSDCGTNPLDCSSPCADPPSLDCDAPDCGDWGNCGDCGGCDGCGDCGGCST